MLGCSLTVRYYIRCLGISGFREAKYSGLLDYWQVKALGCQKTLKSDLSHETQVYILPCICRLLWVTNLVRTLG